MQHEIELKVLSNIAPKLIEKGYEGDVNQFDVIIWLYCNHNIGIFTAQHDYIVNGDKCYTTKVLHQGVEKHSITYKESHKEESLQLAFNFALNLIQSCNTTP